MYSGTDARSTDSQFYIVTKAHPDFDGKYTVFYTGFEQPPDWTRLLAGKGGETCAIGFAEVKAQ